VIKKYMSGFEQVSDKSQAGFRQVANIFMFVGDLVFDRFWAR